MLHLTFLYTINAIQLFTTGTKHAQSAMQSSEYTIRDNDIKLVIARKINETHSRLIGNQLYERLKRKEE